MKDTNEIHEGDIVQATGKVLEVRKSQDMADSTCQHHVAHIAFPIHLLGDTKCTNDVWMDITALVKDEESILSGTWNILKKSLNDYEFLASIEKGSNGNDFLLINSDGFYGEGWHDNTCGLIKKLDNDNLTLYLVTYESTNMSNIRQQQLLAILYRYANKFGYHLNIREYKEE